ncbi:hypothetical protein, partial [Plasmodium yoelii yoelii]
MFLHNFYIVFMLWISAEIVKFIFGLG